GELFGAGSCACQKEIGHIGARDQEHQPDRGQQHEERGRSVAGHGLSKRCSTDRPPVIPWPILLGQPGAECIHFRLGLRRGYSRLQPRDGGKEMAARAPGEVAEQRVLSKLDPKLPPTAVELESKIAWHHSHHRERPLVQLDGRPDQVRVRAETAPPQSLADHRDRGGTLLAVLGQEGAAQQRRNAQNREKVCRHVSYPYRHGFALAGQREFVPVNRGHSTEDVILPPPLQELRVGAAIPPYARRLVRFENPEQLTRTGKGQRLQKHGVHRAEYGCIRADAQGQGQNSHRREYGIPAQLAEARAKILSQCVHHGQSPFLATFPGARSPPPASPGGCPILRPTPLPAAPSGTARRSVRPLFSDMSFQLADRPFPSQLAVSRLCRAGCMLEYVI